MQESSLKWYGRVLRREGEYVGKRVMLVEVPGKRRRGRPKRRWLDNIKKDMSEIELSGDEALDRIQRWGLIGNIDRTYKWERMRKKKKTIIRMLKRSQKGKANGYRSQLYVVRPKWENQ